MENVERSGWGFVHGEQIFDGRLALQRLGGGELCETWLAWDRTLFGVVVVKILRPDRLASVGQLAAEAEALDALSHPVIVRAFDAVLEGPRPHLVLEHLEGPTLRSTVRRTGAQSLEQVLPLALQLCSALHYLHGRGWVHLDVKGRNVVLGPTARLLDLSLARRADAARRLDEALGTPVYMAPEQCDPVAAGGVGPAADMWGLGVTMFEAMSGSRPFPEGRDEDDESLPLAVRYPQTALAPGPLPSELPLALQEAVLHCLAPDPADRPAPAELALSLEPMVAALPAPVLGVRRRPRFR